MLKNQLGKKTSHFHLSFYHFPFSLSFTPFGVIFPVLTVEATGNHSWFYLYQFGTLALLIHFHVFLFNYSLYFISLGSLEIPRSSNMINAPLKNRGGRCLIFKHPGRPSRGALALYFFFSGSVGHKSWNIFYFF